MGEWKEPQRLWEPEAKKKQTKRRRILVIGGGASGLVAAIAAARNGAKVTVLEKNTQVGKKLLATGNGKCNLTNRDQRLSHYHCGEPDFPGKAFEVFGYEETLAFFKELGIYPKDRNGYLYPYSQQAQAVADILRMEAEGQRVKLACNTEILGMEKREGRFFVETPGWTYEGEALIMACGSRASSLGSGDGYAYAGSFGHRILPTLPALVQLRGGKDWPCRLSGIRLDAVVSLYGDGELLGRDTGEVQMTDYGLSGIPVFQVSGYASWALENGQRVEAQLAFLPEFSETEKRDMLQGLVKHGGGKSLAACLAGLFPRKLIPVLLERAGMEKGLSVRDMTERQMERLLGEISHFCVPVTATNGFVQAQVCKGGVDVSQVEPGTMESRLVRGLYFAGELLDVDGDCGGYNLQWAWTSGYLAGQAAAGEVRLEGEETP